MTRVQYQKPSLSQQTNSEDDIFNEEKVEDAEEEEERFLSSRHGEAAESISPTKKRSRNDKNEADKDIENKLANTRPKQKPRVTLNTSHLNGPNGLQWVKSEFPKMVRKYNTDKIGGSERRGNDVAEAASYGKSLMSAYRNFCFKVFPQMAPEDVLSRIESFGPKPEIKKVMNEMRADVKNSFLHSIYGKEVANRILSEEKSTTAVGNKGIVISPESLPPVESLDDDEENEYDFTEADQNEELKVRSDEKSKSSAPS